jgi:hypothetical protein
MTIFFMLFFQGFKFLIKGTNPGYQYFQQFPQMFQPKDELTFIQKDLISLFAGFLILMIVGCLLDKLVL